MKRERETGGDVAAGAENGEEEEKNAITEEKEKEKELELELCHFSYGDGSGGFRTSALLSDENVKNDDEEEESDDDGEDHRSAYVAYVITDRRGKPSCCSLRPPPAVQSQVLESREETCQPPHPPGTTVMPTSTTTSRRRRSTATEGTMSLVHTYTPRRLRGRGLAERLCVEAFRWAAANQLRVDPECTYVSDTFLSRRPEFRAHVVHQGDRYFDTQLSEEGRQRKPRRKR